MTRTLRRSAILLWLLAPALLWLTLHRPFTGASGRAAHVPQVVGEFRVASDHALTPREFELLGTDDATWRTYQDRNGAEIFVVVLFHQENWKSVHPPHLCLRGSDMLIDGDGVVMTKAADGTAFDVGRILASNRVGGRRYLSNFVYGARGLRTSSYAGFVLHHLPRAIARVSAPGYLLRVETWVDGDLEAADARCMSLLLALVPHLEELLRE